MAPTRDSGEQVEVDAEFLQRQVVPYYGSGAAFLDIDGDGDLDLFAVSAGHTEDASANALYRNDGDGTFTDVTRPAGVGDKGLGMGVTYGDFDNDGDTDLYVTNYGPNVMYRNNGDGTFTDVTEGAVVGIPGLGMWATFVDYDHDGFLDLFVANYVEIREMPAWEGFRLPEDLPGEGNVLYRNRGDRTFSDSTEEALLDGRAGSVNAVFFDYHNDIDIDLYLGNDRQPGIMYSNNRDGTFLDITLESGLGGLSRSRGVAASEYDGDSFVDLLVTSGDERGVALFRNQGEGSFARDESFEELAKETEGLDFWGASFVDYDNDGHLDIVAVTGSQEGIVLLYRNRGDGVFAEVSEEAGLREVSGLNGRGLTLGDYDNDGDADLFIVNNGGPPNLLRNNGGNRNRWLKVTMVGDGSNRMGFGSKVEVKAGRLWQKREVVGGSGYLSQNSSETLFGLAGQE